MRLDQVFVGAFGLSHKCDRHFALSCLDANRFGAEVVGSGRQIGRLAVARNATVVAQQRHTHAINRYIEIFNRATNSTAHVQAKLIFAVGREVVVEHHATARAVRGTINMIPRVLRLEW